MAQAQKKPAARARKSTSEGLQARRIPLGTIELEAEPDDRTEGDILAELEQDTDGARYQIRVFQLEPKPGGGQQTEIYLYELEQADELNGIWDRLRDSLGTGTYRIRVRRNTDGRSVQIAQMTRAVKSMRAPLAPAIAPSSPPADGLTARLDRLERLLEQRAAAPALDPLEMMRIFTTMQTNIAQTIQQQAPQVARNPMEDFRAGVEFVRELGTPPASEDGGLGAIATALAPIVGKFIENMPARSSSPPAAPNAAPAIAAPRTPPPLPSAQAYMLGIVQQLCDLDAQGVDPAQAAEFVFENVPLNLIRQLANDETMLTGIAAAVPQVQARWGFFAGLRQAIRAELNHAGDDDERAADDSNPATGGPGGNAGNAQSDARANTTRETERPG